MTAPEDGERPLPGALDAVPSQIATPSCAVNCPHAAEAARLAALLEEVGEAIDLAFDCDTREAWDVLVDLSDLLYAKTGEP